MTACDRLVDYVTSNIRSTSFLTEECGQTGNEAQFIISHIIRSNGEQTHTHTQMTVDKRFHFFSLIRNAQAFICNATF